jgi:hypothetical protein
MTGKPARAMEVLESATPGICRSVRSPPDDHGAHCAPHHLLPSHGAHLAARWSDVVAGAAAAPPAFKSHVQDGSHAEFDAINRH